jgi:hypothetical protein
LHEKKRNQLNVERFLVRTTLSDFICISNIANQQKQLIALIKKEPLRMDEVFIEDPIVQPVSDYKNSIFDIMIY